MAFAGLWEEWTDRSSGEIIESCTILTTGANQVMSRIHHRMPVIVEPEDCSLWLDPGHNNVNDLAELFKPCEDDVLQLMPVSTYVNNARHEGAECIKSA